jgi:vacuolar-type H+-ATPase subunit H
VTGPNELLTALAPVRAAMLAAAGHDVDRIVAESRAAGQQRIADAQAHGARLRQEARERGAADAAAAMAEQRSRVGRRARAIVMRAHREEYDALHEAARQAAPRLVEEPDYPGLRPNLAEAVRTLLGPDALLRDASGGGVIGQADGRRVDFSLARFADRAVDQVVAELGELDEPAELDEP